MLQTRLYPYFKGEGRKLLFAAAPAYLNLVRACLIFGLLGALAGFVGPAIGVSLPIDPTWWVAVGVMVASAGVLAALSLPSITFNLKERVYRRWDGISSLGRQTGGSMNELDAVVLTSHQSLFASVAGGGVGIEFRVTLYWQGSRHPPLLLALDHRSLPGGQPIGVVTGPILQLAQRIAGALGVRLYDNSAVLS